MAIIKVFSSKGVKVLDCFDNLDNLDYLSDPEEETLQDDGELLVSEPIE